MPRLSVNEFDSLFEGDIKRDGKVEIHVLAFDVCTYNFLHDVAEEHLSHWKGLRHVMVIIAIDFGDELTVLFVVATHSHSASGLCCSNIRVSWNTKLLKSGDG
ncbi:hypothetical protein D3C75_740250 [compost metagenome]